MKTSKEIFKWLRANCGKNCTAPLTSHDVNALVASVALTPLISYAGASVDLFQAYRAVVMEMQPKCRWLAYHAIAMELDWGHRAMIWIAAALPEGDKPAQLAAFEPGGCREDLSKR
jgi:hypothetical protein